MSPSREIIQLILSAHKPVKPSREPVLALLALLVLLTRFVGLFYLEFFHQKYPEPFDLDCWARINSLKVRLAFSSLTSQERSLSSCCPVSLLP